MADCCPHYHHRAFDALSYSHNKRKGLRFLILLAKLYVLRHLQAVACQLRDHPKQWEPLFSIVEAGGEEWIDAQDWCTGFLQAIDLQPDGWSAWQQDAELGPALATIALLGGEDDEIAPEVREELADPAARDAMAHSVVAGVLAMHERGRS